VPKQVVALSALHEQPQTAAAYFCKAQEVKQLNQFDFSRKDRSIGFEGLSDARLSVFDLFSEFQIVYDVCFSLPNVGFTVFKHLP
jgi:hypothetical protein